MMTDVQYEDAALREMAVKITDKQEAFAVAFMKFHGRKGAQVQAYRQAYSTSNMSDKSCYVAACRLVRNPKVALRVEQLRRKAFETNEVTVQDLVRDLAAVVNTDFPDIADFDGVNLTFKPWEELTPAQRRAILGIKVIERTSEKGCARQVEYRLRDRNAANKQLAELLLGKLVRVEGGDALKRLLDEVQGSTKSPEDMIRE